MITVRRLRGPDEFAEAVRVQISAWRMAKDSCEATPAHLLKALSENGGIVLGAFDDDGRLVGVSAGWFVGGPEGPYFYSHITGVVDEMKYRGVGFQLKLAQRREVLSYGVRLIKWTFDPLQRLNVNFNLNKLGAVFRRYAVNYYGPISDGINAGLETDRAIAEWHLDSVNATRKIEGGFKVPSAEELTSAGAHVAVGLEREGGLERPLGPFIEDGAEVVLVALPRSITDLNSRDPRLAAAWRDATRRAYTYYLERGYVASDYTTDSAGTGYAVLVRMELADVLEGMRPWS